MPLAEAQPRKCKTREESTRLPPRRILPQEERKALGLSGVEEIPVRWAHQEGAAAFATRGAYLKAGLKMLADVVIIRTLHARVEPLATTAAPLSQ